MVKNKRIIYSVDDYLKDRRARTEQSAISTPTGVQYARSGAAFSKPATYVTSPEAKETTILPSRGQNGSSVVSPGKSVSFSPSLPSNTNTTPGAQESVTNQNPMLAPLSEAEIAKYNMDQAAQKVYEILNRRFKYNAKESPLYLILQKQSEREAELAAGQAYARSVANTGGYGSSYATLSAEEARRQSMANMDDQQLALYQAARQEFFDERQSVVDWYNQARVMYENALKDEEYKKLMEEEAAREASGVSEQVAEAASLLLSGNFTEYSENTMRSLLETTGQYDKATINAALEQVKKTMQAGIYDVGNSVSDIYTAMSYKNTLDTALRNKTLSIQEYDDEITKNSSKIMDEVYKDINRLEDMDYAALGYSADEWNAMEDGDKKLAVFDSVGQMVNEGVVTRQDYYKLIYNDLQEEFDSEEYKTSKTKTRTAVDSAIVVKDLYDNGYLNEDLYRSLIYEKILPEIENDETFRAIANSYTYYVNHKHNETLKEAVRDMDAYEPIPGDNKYGEEEKIMMIILARDFNETKSKKKNKG